jgi:2,3-bisphosphoglycerate-independent phosphoglycerate mutase
MKYIVILGDGMADEKIEKINNQTPLQVAHKPTIDRLSKNGELGLVSTIPKGMSPGSDTANLSVMGYDPRQYYTGRSPLEAISIGIDMKDTDISYRCNFVTLTEEENYNEKTILDHSSGEITTDEARALMDAIIKEFSNDYLTFYKGVSYRHILIWAGGSTNVDLTPPHNILEQKIGAYMPKGDGADIIYDIMKRSYDVLKNHEVNLKRIERGLNPANSLWIWGEGKKPMLSPFEEKYGLKGTMISAVDLLKGIALGAKMTSIDVEGATGNLHTNYEGKAMACIEALENGSDFVYVHVEAPDECGHQGVLEDKIKSIELIDEKIVSRVVNHFDANGLAYRILVLPDHPTPLAIRTHTNKPVPYALYDSTKIQASGLPYNEETAGTTGNFFDNGYQLMAYFLEK